MIQNPVKLLTLGVNSNRENLSEQIFFKDGLTNKVLCYTIFKVG